MLSYAPVGLPNNCTTCAPLIPARGPSQPLYPVFHRRAKVGLYGMGMRLRLRAGMILLFCLVSLGWAQSSPQLSPECSLEQPQPFCIRPSVLMRLGLNRAESGTWAAQVAFGVKAEARGRWGTVNFSATPALWVDNSLQADLLEAYASAPLGSFRLELGKRTGYGGPWDDTLLGRNGRWGLFAHYSPAELPWLGAEAAYLPHPGFAGGEGFLGAQVGPLRLGSFIEAVEGAGAQWSPRVGLEFGSGDLYWQSDRGFWADVNTPLPLGQALAYGLRCLPDSGACWGRGLPALDDPNVQTLLKGFNEGQFGLSLWWNPDWALLGTTDPDTGDTLSFLGWLTRPQKFFLGLTATLRQFRFGFDASLAPVGGYRVYLEVRLP